MRKDSAACENCVGNSHKSAIKSEIRRGDCKGRLKCQIGGGGFTCQKTRNIAAQQKEKLTKKHTLPEKREKHSTETFSCPMFLQIHHGKLHWHDGK